MDLWYTRPASIWQEALPIGNGRLGAMIFGGIRRERIQLNEDTIWGGGPYTPANPDAREHLEEVRQLIFGGEYDMADRLGNSKCLGVPARQPAYQPFGELYIETHGVPEMLVSDYKRSLSLDTAMVEVGYTYNNARYTRRYIASPDRQVVTISITSSQPNSINLNLFTGSPHPQTSVIYEGNVISVIGENSPENGLDGEIRFEGRFEVKADGGSVTSSKSQVLVRDATEVTILIAIGTNFKRYDDITGDPHALVLEHLARCKGVSFDTLAAETEKSHRQLFDRVQLRLEDTDRSSLPTDERLSGFAAGQNDPSLIALYFQFGRYLLITSSRPNSQPANLQGIWNDSVDPGWGCGYTININTEMNYWLAEPTSLPEMVEPLIRLVEEISETGRETASVMYGAEGWVCHQNTDIWRATAPNTGARWSLWPTGGAWLCRHLWDHYDYHRDDAYLARIQPVLVGACLFFLSTMVEDPVSGYMVTTPSCSPENHHGVNGSDTTLCAGPTMDMQILRDLFTHTIASCRILNRDTDVQQRIEALRSRLRPTTIGPDGRINEWPDHLEITEPEKNHRHTSHLYGLYPSHQIDPHSTPSLAHASAKTLQQRGEAGTGWAAAWRLNLWAWLWDGEECWNSLKTLLIEMTYPNLFDVHPPLSKAYAMGTFQIDGNLGGSAGIVEMLVQSPEGGEVVWLLPALPGQLKKGRLSGARVRGGWSVDVEWEEGELVIAVLRAESSGTKQVRYKSATREVKLAVGEEVTLIGPKLEVAS